MSKEAQLPGEGAFSRVEPFLYLLPFLVGIAVFTLYPVINVALMSFKEGYNHLTRGYTGIGFGNYLEVINNRYFLQAFAGTFAYVMCVVPTSTAIAIIVAYLLNQKIRGAALLQTAYFMPMVTSVTAVGLAWRLMLNQNVGIINFVLSWFGAQKINWIEVGGHNLASLVMYGVWNILPFTIILMLSGLQNINPLYYTAARVDGARSLRVFFRITVPMLAPTIGLVLIVNTISSFKVFNELFPLFGGKPGPALNMYTVVYYIYEQMTGRPKFGRSAAAAILLFLVIFVFTMLELLVQKKWKRW